MSAALLTFALLAFIGGSEHGLDNLVIRSFGAWRVTNAEATSLLILLTHAGGAPFLLSVAALGALALLTQGRRAQAMVLVLTVLGGRLGLELLKLIADRPRPAFDAHPVIVFSQSFPSGHAGNSTITYLALALFVAPERWRTRAIISALILALAIGATRPILGVHWPSDVVGGWIYGLLVVSLAWQLSERARSAA